MHVHHFHLQLLNLIRRSQTHSETRPEAVPDDFSSSWNHPFFVISQNGFEAPLHFDKWG